MGWVESYQSVESIKSGHLKAVFLPRRRKGAGKAQRIMGAVEGNEGSAWG
jgi:hypothetical protein